jgi:DNA-binding protein HU-beta
MRFAVSCRTWPICCSFTEDVLIKLDIINEVVNKTGITKTKAEMAVETVFESMKRALGQGERIELRGFGIFNVRPRKTGIGRNPRTGAEVAIPPGRPYASNPAKNSRHFNSASEVTASRVTCNHGARARPNPPGAVLASCALVLSNPAHYERSRFPLG